MILLIYLSVVAIHTITLSSYIARYESEYANWYSYMGIFLTGLAWPLFWSHWLYLHYFKKK